MIEFFILNFLCFRFFENFNFFDIFSKEKLTSFFPQKLRSHYSNPNKLKIIFFKFWKIFVFKILLECSLSLKRRKKKNNLKRVFINNY